MDVMSYQYWKRHTYGGPFSVRSAELKRVDSALKKYHQSKSQADLNELRFTLAKWKQAKGANWKSSIRNKDEAVEILTDQITSWQIGPGPLSGAERVALSHVRAEADAVLNTLFLNKKLVWRSGFSGKLRNNEWGVRLNAAGAARNTRILAPNVGLPGPPMPGRPGSNSQRAGNIATDIFNTLVPSELRADVAAELAKIMPGFMTELAASLTPFVGVIVSGGSATLSGVRLARDEYRLYYAKLHKERSLSVETPEQAIKSMISVMQREQNFHALDGSVALGEFAGKLAGVLADGGTATNAAIGLAANVLKLTNIIRIVVRDVQEKKAANLLMQKPVRVDVFETCPVMGAYYVCCVPTSALVNGIFERFRQFGWRDDVEHAVKKHIEPLRAQGRRLIREHRFVIPELQNSPGVLEVNKKKLKQMKKNKGKTGMVGFGSDSLPPILEP
ncbi:MAG: hypothetical protein WD737_14690 [Gemmatimonadota bacterium]